MFKVGDRIRIKADAFVTFVEYNLKIATITGIDGGSYNILVDCGDGRGEVEGSIYLRNAEPLENGIQRAKRIICLK